jgi:hypothetical protein
VGSAGDVRYNLKVCGSLAVTHGNPCAGQTGVCRYRTQPASADGGSGMVLTDAVNLGIMYRWDHCFEGSGSSRNRTGTFSKGFVSGIFRNAYNIFSTRFVPL